MRSIPTLILLGVLLPAGALAQTHLREGLTVAYKSPPAPALRLAALDGREHDLAAMRGRVVVINFWATWCPPCIEELPSMQRLWEAMHDDGLDILAVNAGERAEGIEAFLRDFDVELAFPIVLDPEGRAFGDWRVLGLPKTFVVDKQGRIIYEAEGGRDMSSEHIQERLRALLNE